MVARTRSSQITFCRQLSQAGKRARSQCSAAPATSNTAVTTINQQQRETEPSTSNHHQPSPTIGNNAINHQPVTLGHCQQPAKAQATINHNHHVHQQTATESERGIFLLVRCQSPWINLHFINSLVTLISYPNAIFVDMLTTFLFIFLARWYFSSKVCESAHLVL